MTRHIALKLAYDGGAYHGWQIQKNEISVCQTLKEAIIKTCGAAGAITGCGRTDAGVHAKTYCASFRTDSSIPAERLPLALNSRLPADISVKAALDVPGDFCPIRSCVKKEYEYLILNSQIRDPFLSGRACFYPSPLDMKSIERAAKFFEGTHDFAAVRSLGTETKTTVRTIYWCRAEKTGELIRVAICADGFLYNMARAITGTLIYAGHGKIAPEDIPALLKKGDRRRTGPTMPPQGLYLSRIWYNGPVGEMMSENQEKTDKV